MRFAIQQEVFETFGDISVGIIHAGGLGAVSHEAIVSVVEESERTARCALDKAGSVGALPCVRAWRAIFEKMGAGRSKCSSIESLYSLLTKSASLPTILPLVDFYNAVSVRWGLPMAGYDTDGFDGDLALRNARKGETFTPLGRRQEEKTKGGEVVYADRQQIVCRYWNYKDCDATKLKPDSANVLFIMDGAPEASHSDIAAAQTQVSDVLRALGAEEVSARIADRANSTVTFATG